MMKKIETENGNVIMHGGDDLFGYFGWPSVARLRDGSLAVAVSGYRNSHVCPFGKTVLITGSPDGRKWNTPQIINDTAIDDRDAGIIELADGSLLISHFTSDTGFLYADRPHPEPAGIDYRPVLDSWDAGNVASSLGSFVRRRSPDGEWGELIAVKVSTPHGPIVLGNGELFYIGRNYGEVGIDGKLHFSMEAENYLQVFRSGDNGETWRATAPRVRLPEWYSGRVHEPHAIELADGTILAHIRVHPPEKHFEIHQITSADGGKTWSEPEYIASGSPPHLMRHSSGVLICSYGYRRPPYGERVMFSCDEGKSWDIDWILRDDGPDGDLGYPATVELEDGTLFTVYYQHEPGNRNAGVMYSRWKLPEAIRDIMVAQS